jgi:xylulokinase
MASNGLFYPRVPSSTFKKLQQNQNHTPSHMRGMLAHSLGISFDPYDSSRLPKRIIAVGTAANFPSVVGLLADVFDAPIFVPASPSPSPFTSPDGRLTPGGGNNAPSPSPGGLGSTSNIPLLPTPSRPSACIGGAYLARWAWRRSVRPDEKYATFEDEIRHLLKKKWSGLALPVSTSGPLDAFSPVGRSVSSSYLRSALASTTFKEEDEDEVNAASSAGDGGAGFDALGFTNGLNNNGISNGAARTTTSSSAGNQTSSPIVPTISTSGTNGAAGGNTNNSTPPPLSAAPTTITLSALPTEETEIQLGLVKVAESDTDSFMTYAAIVPEYCRLEGMLVKALV